MFSKKIDYSKNKKKYLDGYSGGIEKLIKPKSKVLDVGCSTGKLAQVLAKKGCKVVGLDIDENSLKQAEKFCDKVIACDLDEIKTLNQKIKRKFDFIAMGDLLEHIKYPGVLLFNLKNFLNSGGAIVTSIPNAAFILNRINFAFGKFDYNPKGGLMDEDHLRFFSFATAKKLFADSGYRVEIIYGVSAVQKKYWFLAILAKMLPTLFAIHIIILAKKK